MANQENEPQYNPDMRVARKTTEGPIGPGTSFHAEMTGKGRVVPMTIRVTEYERPRTIRERVEMQAMDLTGGLDFEPTDDGTRTGTSGRKAFCDSWGRWSRAWDAARSGGFGRDSSGSWRAG